MEASKERLLRCLLKQVLEFKIPPKSLRQNSCKWWPGYHPCTTNDSSCTKLLPSRSSLRILRLFRSETCSMFWPHIVLSPKHCHLATTFWRTVPHIPIYYWQKEVPLSSCRYPIHLYVSIFGKSSCTELQRWTAPGGYRRMIKSLSQAGGRSKFFLA